MKMSEKIINSRIIQKHDTEENWLKAVNFIPKKGEIIVYDIDSTHTQERFKIGDGVTLVTNLPFQKGAAIVKEASGTTVSITDSATLPIAAFSVYGESIQNGTPTITNPIDLIDIPAGNLTITVGATQVTVNLPISLKGIKVKSGGNYTDADGQKWVCDELDLNRGVIIKRVDVVTGDRFTWSANSNRWQCPKVSNPSPAAVASNQYFEIMSNVATFKTDGSQNSCRPGNYEYAGMMLLFVPSSADLSNAVVYYQCAEEEIALTGGATTIIAAEGTMEITNSASAYMKVVYPTEDAKGVESLFNNIYVRKDMIIVSETEPASPVEGMLWFDIS